MSSVCNKVFLCGRELTCKQIATPPDNIRLLLVMVGREVWKLSGKGRFCGLGFRRGRLNHGVIDLSVTIALGYKFFRSCWGGQELNPFTKLSFWIVTYF